MFFTDNREQFFRPLTSKYREVVIECVRLLYLRLYSSMADYGHSLKREQLIEIFQEAITRAPELEHGEDDDAIATRTEREKANWILNILIDNGWLEIQLDEVTLQSTYRFSRIGRLFSQPFVELKGAQVRTRHRNTRNTRNALSAFLEQGEIHDLLDAFEYSERIISDFTDVIAELEDRKRELVKEIDMRELVQKASDEFFDFMEKRFQPDLSVRLSADSVEKHRDDMISLIGKIRNQSKGFKAEAEQKLREFLPDMVVEGQSLLWTILDTIEARLSNACEIMLPALRTALKNFTKRADIIIRQLNYLASQQHNDVVEICQSLKELDHETANQRLEQAGQLMSGVKLELVDPAQNTLRDNRSRRVVDSLVAEDHAVDESARKELFIQHALDQAFNINQQDLRNFLVRSLRGGEKINSKHFQITQASDLLAATHAIEIAAANNLSSEYRFNVVPTGDITSNDYLLAADDFTIEIETLKPKDTQTELKTQTSNKTIGQTNVQPLTS
ncbi:Wadjet anti-phage system protein JetA family protein [Alkalimarinus sediminis]|uniref:DUF5716 family protein n=1 Tax=Alkalimarinus sediminis TaxID=1632866 RepID=A0A9E8HHI1_9ALTE|nr:Wadjet anti-phage system protein JetA family protein [Alkalimarinus sediminis]UZW74773.1 DUF5716 family protein [Alkalimarinus sediminis]